MEADEGRHPLCPQCGYDLIGTVRARRRVCPECGARFTRSQLAAGVRPWTLWAGLRRAAVVLGLRALVAFPLCFVLDLLLLPALAAPPYGGVLLVLAVAGLGLGHWLGHGLPDYMGRRSLALTALAAAFAWAVVAAAIAPSVWLRPVSGWTAVFSLHTAAIFATISIFKATALDD